MSQTRSSASSPKSSTAAVKTFKTSGGSAAKIRELESRFIRSDLPAFAPGDTVKVHVKIKEGEKERLQVFEGTVIALQNTGASKSFTVRKISHGVGVERVFPVASPSVAKVERLMEGRVRRSKIYYLRGLRGKAATIADEAQTQH